MKFSNVDVNKILNTITVDEVKKGLFSKAGYNAWSKYTEQQQETWIDAAKSITKIKKYTPEQRYGAFVIKEFVRFARAINKAAFLEIDQCIEVYEYDIIGDNSILLDDFLQLPNNGMRKNTEESLALIVAINKIVTKILDEEFDALDTLYYKAFPTDVDLKEVNAKNFNEEPEPSEKKKTQYQQIDEFIKWLSGEAAEAIKKEESKKTLKTKQDIAADFINSERKTRYYK